VATEHDDVQKEENAKTTLKAERVKIISEETPNIIPEQDPW